MHSHLKAFILKRWDSEIAENKINIQKSAGDSDFFKSGKKIHLQLYTF